MKPAPPPLDPSAALFLDVDGTLLEIAPRPELVRVPPELPALLDRLAQQRGGALALISGRALADLERLFQTWRGAAAGLHGAERRCADGSLATGPGNPAEGEAAAAAAALARARPQLVNLARRLAGTWLEDKGRTLALHYRQAPDSGDEIRAHAERLVGQSGNALRLIAGKMVIELQPRSHGKDRAIAAFMAEAPFRSRKPVFLGDDTTDEDGFIAVNRRRGGVSIRVGPPDGATTARYSLPSAAAALAWLAGGAGGGG